MSSSLYSKERVLISSFFYSVILCFSLAAISKLITVGSDVPIIRELDPVFNVRKSFALLMALVLETSLVTLLIVIRNDLFRIRLIALTALLFLSYRLLSLIISPATQCACLGSMGSWIGLSPDGAEMATLIFLCYCLGGVVLFIIARGKKMREPLPEASDVT